jgi:hypothetical protein
MVSPSLFTGFRFSRRDIAQAGKHYDNEPLEAPFY